MPGTVHHSSAERFLRGLSSSSAGLVVVHPPSRLGVGASEDETAFDEQIAALSPAAEQAARVLLPGASTVFLGDPWVASSWELAAAWAGLRPAGELVVLWDQGGCAPSPDVASFTLHVRWHVRPGFQYRPRRPVHLASNVVVCSRVPAEDRFNPAQLPVELFNFLVSVLTERRDQVVDPYCGAGSAMVAAELCGRPWAGCDLDEGQCEVARRRTARTELEEAQLRPLFLWTPRGLVEVEG